MIRVIAIIVIIGFNENIEYWHDSVSKIKFHRAEWTNEERNSLIKRISKLGN